MGISILRNASLKDYNTFGVEVKADSLAVVRHRSELIQLLGNTNTEPWVLGGGSNVLLTNNIHKLALKIEIKGIEILESDAESIVVRIGAGVVWHDLVLWAVKRGYGGIENLALIPGRVGAAPIQNIGAYGVELDTVFDSLEAIDIKTGDVSTFAKKACQFGYRDSIFKNDYRGKYCITHVNLKLIKTGYRINAEYGAIQNTLSRKGVIVPSIQDVCDAVVDIRSEKLPDPAVLGNSGSFFKNPVVNKAKWEALLDSHHDLVFYPHENGGYKIPAGWLIEQCGWKGKRVGNVGCYEKQALVIVNYGGASGQEILDHSVRVQESVMGKFGISLTTEVNIL